MAESDWLVVMTKPRMETEAKIHLERQRFSVYLPTWVDLRRRSDGWQKVQSAMFPYLLQRPLMKNNPYRRFVRLGVSASSGALRN